MIVFFITDLSFCRVGNQARQPASGFRWSTQLSKRSKDQSAEKPRAKEDCAPASLRASRHAFWKQVASPTRHSRPVELHSQTQLTSPQRRVRLALEIPELRKA